MFPKLEDEIDAETLGARMKSRKEELIQRASRKRAVDSKSRRATKIPRRMNKSRRRALSRGRR